MTSAEYYGNAVMPCVWMSSHVFWVHLLPHSGIPADGQLQPHTCQKGHRCPNVHGASDGRSAAGSTAQSTAPCSERFSTGLLNVKSYCLSSWLTFNLSFQRGFGTSRLEGNAFC